MISIIIPCYNAEKTIKKCLDSVVNQSYKNIEIILINDGSTDQTDKIIQKFLKDHRIKYYDRKNHGIGKTRNFGIQIATGDYITFLDSDDYLDNSAIEKFYKFASEKQLDMVISDYYIVEKNQIEYEKIPSFAIGNIHNLPNLILDVNLSPWNKLYKTECIKGIFFEENLKYEDAPFVIRALLTAKRIGKLNEPTHYYVINSNSETTIRDERIFDVFEILNIIGEHLKSYSFLEDVYKTLVVRILCNYNIQQRYQKKIKVCHHFINKSFKYMKSVDKNYKNNRYFNSRSKLKALIEKSQFLTKFYCTIYIILR